MTYDETTKFLASEYGLNKKDIRLLFRRYGELEGLSENEIAEFLASECNDNKTDIRLLPRHNDEFEGFTENEIAVLGTEDRYRRNYQQMRIKDKSLAFNSLGFDEYRDKYGSKPRF